MKFNIVLTISAILIAALLGYWAYDLAFPDDNAVICGIGSFLSFGFSLVTTLGIRCQCRRGNINMKALSMLSFILLAVSNFTFALFGVKMPLYIIVNGILVLCFFIIYYNLLMIYTREQ